MPRLNQLDFGNEDMPLYPDIRETNLGRAMSNAEVFAPAIGVNEQARASLPDFGDSTFNPNYEAQNRYSQMIDQYPIRDKPSFARKLVAALAGMGGGVGAAEDVINRPHQQNVADWKLRTNEAGQAAIGESRTNRDQASAINQQTSRDIQARRAEIAKQQADTAALKNQQIYETTLAKMQQAITESDAKLKLAYEKMNMDMANKDNVLAFRQAQMDSNNARHAAEMAMKDKQLSDLSSYRDAMIAQGGQRINQGNQRIEQQGLPTETTDTLQTDKEGNVTGRTRVTQKKRPSELPPNSSTTTGAGNSIQMTGPDGKTYNVPANRVVEAEKAGMKRK